MAAVTGKPLVVHVHSTEFDRSGEHVNQQVYDIERAGMHGADRVIGVSHLTRNIVRHPLRRAAGEGRGRLQRHRLPTATADGPQAPSASDEKIVLFLGRITMQKGPEYFLRGRQEGAGEVYRTSGSSWPAAAT